MTFLDAIRSAFGKYATFSGRASRSEFWWWMLFEFLTRTLLGFAYMMTMLALLLPAAAADANNQPGAMDAVLGAIFNPAYFILIAWSLAILLPSLAVMVRRFHDTGRSGWFVLVTFIPLVGTILMIVFLVEESQPVANAWGEPAVTASSTTGETTNVTTTPAKTTPAKATPAKATPAKTAPSKTTPAKKPSSGGSVVPKK